MEQIPETQLQKPTVEPIMQNNACNKFWVVILITLFLLIGGIVGYMLGAKNNIVLNSSLQTIQKNPSPSTSASENYSKPTISANNVSKACIEEEENNLKNNEYLQADKLSVTFYTAPSADDIKKITEQYDLEIGQIYNQPNIVFKVSKEKAPTIKCQLKNETEVKSVVFIENIPVR